ncbi:nuclear transport factor 2 family protein [Pseudomonas sp. PL-6]
MTEQNLELLITELEALRHRAMCEADSAALEQLLAPDLLYIHSDGTCDGKQAYLQGLRSQKWRYQRIECHAQAVRIEGDCGVVSGLMQMNVVIAGQALAMTSRALGVWAKRREGWQLIAWQATRLV